MFKKKDGYKLNYKHLKPWNYLVLQKTNRQNKKRRKCTKSWSVWNVLGQYNSVDNLYQQKPEVLHTFTPNKSYPYLLNVEPSNLVLVKTYNTEFDEMI